MVNLKTEYQKKYRGALQRSQSMEELSAAREYNTERRFVEGRHTALFGFDLWNVDDDSDCDCGVGGTPR